MRSFQSFIQPRRRRALRVLTAALASAWLLGPVPALAQAHEHSSDGYTLRSSVVASTDINASIARQYSIVPSPLRGLVNVSLQRSDSQTWRPVPAEVSIQVRGLLGAVHSVAVREVSESGGVTYLGDFEHQAGEVLDFDISATPKSGGPTLRLQFRERMRGAATR